MKRLVPIQFMAHDGEQVRLEKLRRLAEQVGDAFAQATTSATPVTYGVFTDSEDGLVPAPGNATGFLRYDGVWADVGESCDCEQIEADILALQTGLVAVSAATAAVAADLAALAGVVAALTTSDIAEGSNLYFTDERAQDAVGLILFDTPSIDLVYNDGSNTISANIIDEYVQDLMASTLVDSTSIDFAYSDVGNTLTAAVITANPSGLIGMSAVNGTAATPLRSDGRHAIDPAIVPVWTALHWFDNATGVRVIDTIGAPIPFAEAPDLIVERSIKIIRANSPNLVGIAYGSTGSLTAPAALSSGDLLFTFKGRGYDGTAFSNDRGEIRLVATEAWSNVANGTRWDFLATPNGSTTETGVFRILNATAVQLLNDNQELQIGASQDLRLYHDGTDSVIRNDTGALYVNFGAAQRVRFQNNSNPFSISGVDASGKCYIGFFESNTFATRKGYFGFGNTFDDAMYLMNEENDVIALGCNSTVRLQLDNTSTANETAMLLYDASAAAVVRVTRGAVDSGGSGFRVLRIPN